MQVTVLYFRVLELIIKMKTKLLKKLFNINGLKLNILIIFFFIKTENNLLSMHTFALQCVPPWDIM